MEMQILLRPVSSFRVPLCLSFMRARLTANAEENGEFLEITYALGATSGTSLSYYMGREFGLVLEGELVVERGFERYTLKEGDSLIFDSSTPHRLGNPGTRRMCARWVALNQK